MNARAPITLIALLVIATPALAQDVTPAADHPAQQEADQAAPQPEFTTADQVLDALEAVHIDKLSANVRYTKVRAFMGEREKRIGKMQFTATPREGKPDSKKFGVAFENLVIGNVLDEEPKIYIFDGHWFVEKMPKERIMIKREVVRRGEEVDPLRIGEGPFPIPIGQKKDDILARFDAELLPSDDGLTVDLDDPDIIDDPEALAASKWLIKFTKDAYQVRLTPKPAFEDSFDLTEARLWYKFNKDGTLLPCLAQTVKFDGDVSTVELLNVKLGDEAEVDNALFDTEVPENWDVQIREFDG